MRRMILIMIFLLTALLVVGEGRQLEWTGIKCDSDYDCIFLNYKTGCITNVTSDKITSLDSNSAIKVRNAQVFNKRGECANLMLRFGEIKQHLPLVATHPNCKEQIVEVPFNVTVERIVNVSNNCSINEGQNDFIPPRNIRPKIYFVLAFILSNVLVLIGIHVVRRRRIIENFIERADKKGIIVKFVKREEDLKGKDVLKQWFPEFYKKNLEKTK